MSNEELREATEEELEHSLAYGLRFDGRKRVHSGDEFMARFTAERLAAHLRQSGYVVMKKPPISHHSIGTNASKIPLKE